MFFFFFKQKTAYEIGVRLVGSEMCIRDSCCRPHDLCIGGRGRQTRQNMFSGWVVPIHKDHLPCPQYSTI